MSWILHQPMILKGATKSEFVSGCIALDGRNHQGYSWKINISYGPKVLEISIFTIAS